MRVPTAMMGRAVAERSFNQIGNFACVERGWVLNSCHAQLRNFSSSYRGGGNLLFCRVRPLHG
jgi:hypothetical protein